MGSVKNQPVPAAKRNVPLFLRPEATSDPLAGKGAAQRAGAGAIPAAPGSGPLALISFDVEQFDIPTEYKIDIDLEKQFEIGRGGLATVLELLDKCAAPATFFITAEFAQRYPRLTRGITERVGGRHEIASHGLTHGDLGEGDLLESRRVLESVTGRPVRGFRRARMAPTDPFAISAAGYTYGASENPIWLPGRYNNFFKPRRPYVMGTPSGSLVQIPASATPLVRVPLFWLAFKNLPPFAVRMASRWVLAADGALNTYFHPWEFTDLRGYELPKSVKKVDGTELLGRLERYIEWLKERATLATYETLAERVRVGRAGRARVQKVPKKNASEKRA
jgi:Polysaccharide deacetylase